jgi:hypothetical protein
VAFDFPPGAFTFSLGFLIGLGARRAIGVYDYLGYYDICYIGDEVGTRTGHPAVDPAEHAGGRRDLLPDQPVDHRRRPLARVRSRRRAPAIGVHRLDLHGEDLRPERRDGVHRDGAVDGVRSVFALLLGYSRVPYAAARDGYFFAPFARLHPTAGFPTVSVVVLGLIAIAACMFSLAVVIDALIATRILVQFIGQIAGVMRLRRVNPEMPRPYRIWLYPVPAFVALAGWLFIFLTTNVQVIAFGLGLSCCSGWWRSVVVASP